MNSIQPSPKLLHLAKSNELLVRVVLTVITGCLAWGWLHHIATMALPFGYSHPVAIEDVPQQFWKDQQALLVMRWPMATVIAVSTNFAISAFIRPNKHISKWGYLVLAWPLIDFIPVSMLGILYIPILIGPIVALTISGITIMKRRYWGNLLSLAWSVIWMSVALTYGGRLWNLAGD